MSRVCLLTLAALLACARAYKEGIHPFEAGVAISEDDIVTLRSLFQHPRRFQTQPVQQHRTRRQDNGLHLPASYVIPGGEGDGPWGVWGEVSPCSRTCGGGVASQKRICLQPGTEGQPLCTGGDTKYFSCETQDCPEGSGDFRAEQCAEFNDIPFSGFKYNWLPYTKALNPCELNCKPHGERFYFQQKLQVTDGTRCNDESFDVCVNGKCQPVGCDMMLNSTARWDKCRECRGNGTNCRTIEGIVDLQDYTKGYNDILLIPEGSTSIIIEEVEPSQNYLALRAKNGTYYLNGHYHIDFPERIMIAGALWTYERSPHGFPAPDKLRYLGPTTEPLYVSLLFQEDNVGIKYEYSVPIDSAPPTDKRYNWVHEQFTPCSATCGGDPTQKADCSQFIDEYEKKLDCYYGLYNYTLNGCIRWECREDPCIKKNCSSSEHCERVLRKNRTPAGDLFSAFCVSDVDCEPFEMECNKHCDFGIEKTRGADGCDRCKCKRDPCNTTSCAEGLRCVLQSTLLNDKEPKEFSPKCETVVKAGACPAAETSPHNDTCPRECADDADCRGAGKCCPRGCSLLCLAPVQLVESRKQF